MLTDKKIIGKLEQIENRYGALRFETIADVPVQMAETREHFRQEPSGQADVKWRSAPSGTQWGGPWMSAWFRGDVKLPASCAGRKVFIRAKTNGETLFLVDGEPRGVFDGNHPVVLVTMRGIAGRKHHLAFEAYAGHFIPGCMPDDNPTPPGARNKTFDGIELVLEREDVSAFIFDLRVLRLLAQGLDENSLRRNKIIAGLAKVYELVDAMPAHVEEQAWRPKLAAARRLMRPLLACKNGPTMPTMGLIGHSHIDTAWLWPLNETWRKAARTFSSMLNLMEQYPELIFIQSVPCHSEVIRKEYPSIFRRMKRMAAEGRWEVNGPMWVEPDCNIPSGEAFVRQLLIGQQSNRRLFGRSADTLWQPDVFGYSAALPQLLRGAGVEFFCSTKIAWNDTTRFPYDTFIWEGIDSSTVLSHYNSIHCWPDPKTLIDQWNWVQHKDVQDRRLTAFGFGDGGGGPQAEMMEVARRVGDLEGCPRTRHTTVSDFMKGIRDELKDLPRWVGELYLELHRGTLTSIAKIKRGNRKAELALREAEFLCTLAALRGARYPAGKFEDLWKTLLTNQFHDILPGSSIAEVNDEAVRDFDRCITGAGEVGGAALKTLAKPGGDKANALLLINSLSWDRTRAIELSNVPAGMRPADENLPAQWIQDVTGTRKLIVGGVSIPALGSTVLLLVKGRPGHDARFTDSPFTLNQDGSRVETPHAVIRLDDIGRIVSLVDKASGREVVKPGGKLNTLLIGEDVPAAWDNWDLDRDQAMKLRPAEDMDRWQVVYDGPLQWRVRSVYKLGTASTLTQDMVLHADSPQIDFDTQLDWNEKHRMLKVGFDLNVMAESARHEIQYGHVERPLHGNLPQDRARFEVCAHKWTDVSDNGFGVAILNDCKYGIGVWDGQLRLSLMRSGRHPDTRGDAGTHRFAYALLPHASGFSVESVVRPAYELNIPVTAARVSPTTDSLAAPVGVDSPDVIIESIKWAAEGKAFIVRLYEAGKTGGTVKLRFTVPVTKVTETNLLEDPIRPLALRGRAAAFTIRPFQIRTLRCEL